MSGVEDTRELCAALRRLAVALDGMDTVPGLMVHVDIQAPRYGGTVQARVDTVATIAARLGLTAELRSHDDGSRHYTTSTLAEFGAVGISVYAPLSEGEVMP